MSIFESFAARWTQQPREFEPIPFRIRIGVTGHRQIEDADELRRCVHRALEEYVPRLFAPAKQKHGITVGLCSLLSSMCDPIRKLRREPNGELTPLRFHILSPLAEGADRIVAEAVLDRPGARLEAILPMDRDEYSKDFITEESRAEFDRLLAQCPEPVQLSTLWQLPEDGQPAKVDRSAAYQAVGQHLVKNSDLLIAVWDGKPARGSGGTAEVVAHAKLLRLPVIRIWQGEIEILNESDAILLDTEALESLRRFNSAKVRRKRYQEKIGEQEKLLFGKKDCSNCVPERSKHFVRSMLYPYYAWASVIAENSRDRFHSSGRLVYWLSAASVALAACGTLLGEAENRSINLPVLFFSLELVALLIVLAILWRMHAKKAQPDWIENRFLAERIRCGVFLSICGERPAPIEVPSHMGSKEFASDWTERVNEELWERVRSDQPKQQVDYRITRCYCQLQWIDNQIKYHDKNASEQRSLLRNYERFGSGIVLVTIAAASTHVLMGVREIWGFPGNLGDWLRNESVHRGATFAALALPAVAASLAGIEAHREFQRLATRSELMKMRLELVRARIQKAGDEASFIHHMHEAARILLQETLDWMTLMRHVEIKAG